MRGVRALLEGRSRPKGGRDEGSKNLGTIVSGFGGTFFTFSFLASFGGLFWGLGIFIIFAWGSFGG